MAVRILTRAYLLWYAMLQAHLVDVQRLERTRRTWLRLEGGSGGATGGAAGIVPKLGLEDPSGDSEARSDQISCVEGAHVKILSRNAPGVALLRPPCARVSLTVGLHMGLVEVCPKLGL